MLSIVRKKNIFPANVYEGEVICCISTDLDLLYIQRDYREDGEHCMWSPNDMEPHIAEVSRMRHIIHYPQEYGDVEEFMHKTNLHGWSIFHYAVCEGRGDFIQLLISKGADVNKTDKKGRSPLYLALKYGPSLNYAVTCLLKAGAKLVIPEENYPFRHSIPILKKFLKIVNLRGKEDTSYDVKSTTDEALKTLLTAIFQCPFHDKCLWDALGEVMVMCSEFKDEQDKIKVDFFTSVFCAIEEVCTELGKECKLSSRHEPMDTIFLTAIRAHCVDLMKFLISKGVSTDRTAIEPFANYLDLAVECNSFESVAFFVSIGIKPSNSLTGILSYLKDNIIDPKIVELVAQHS